MRNFGQTALLEPARADSTDIRVDSNVEQAFLYKTLRTPKRRSNAIKALILILQSLSLYKSLD